MAYRSLPCILLHALRLAPRAPIAVVLVALAAAASADTVTRRDGSVVEGKVVSFDGNTLVLRVEDRTVTLAREALESIRFGEEAPRLPPLTVEIRNVASDEAVDVMLEDEVVIREARTRGEWVDLTPKLKDGNNALRLRIHNSRGTWAYRINVRINGKSNILSCGQAFDLNKPCRCCGKTGWEGGVIDDLPVIWLYVDRAAGRAEILQ